jgi:hypothetical protein
VSVLSSPSSVGSFVKHPFAVRMDKIENTHKPLFNVLMNASQIWECATPAMG